MSVTLPTMRLSQSTTANHLAHNQSSHTKRWMIQLTTWSLICLLSPFVSPAPAAPGKYNSKIDPGDSAPSFSDLPGVDGKSYGLTDFKAKAVVVVFTSNTCPYSIDYEPRFQALLKTFEDRDNVELIAINPNAVPDDSLEKMTAKAKAAEWSFPYVKDEKGEIAEAYGAIRTPECFVLDAHRKIVYLGAFDDNADADKVEKSYVEEAIRCVLNGKEIEVAETPPVGCAIRQKRRRR